jgi:hypothetical protein
MNATARLFYILTAFFGVLAVVYLIWSLNDPLHPQEVEWVGTLGIALCGLLSLLIAFYVGRIHAAQGGELPEDRLDANIDDGDAEQGFFSPWSWWPVVLAGGCALLFLGVAAGVWIVYIGLGLTAVALVGWTFEYYRGNFGR